MPNMPASPTPTRSIGEPMAITLTSALLIALAAFVIGYMVMLSIRFGEWFWRRLAQRRERRRAAGQQGRS
jgi:hypothetical protein